MSAKDIYPMIVSAIISFITGGIIGGILHPIKLLIDRIIGYYDWSIIQYGNNFLLLIVGISLGFAISFILFSCKSRFRVFISWLLLSVLTFLFTIFSKNPPIEDYFSIEFSFYFLIITLFLSLTIHSLCCVIKNINIYLKSKPS